LFIDIFAHDCFNKGVQLVRFDWVRAHEKHLNLQYPSGEELVQIASEKSEILQRPSAELGEKRLRTKYPDRFAVA